MGKTLYVSDLDGTLLGNDERLSSYTLRVLHDLVEKGMLFSYATARSLTTARVATEGLCVNLPVIVYNGAFVMESKTGKRLYACHFSHREAKKILASLHAGGVSPRVYALLDGTERFSYVEKTLSEGTKAFLEKRKGDKRARVVKEDALCDGEVFAFSCIDRYDLLLPLYERMKSEHQCLFYRDPYTDRFWLEVLPQNATKAEALGFLKGYLGCEKTVVFGDSMNDISLFRVADEAYAVANAEEEVKKMASGVILANGQDGVAKWLEVNYEA